MTINATIPITIPAIAPPDKAFSFNFSCPVGVEDDVSPVVVPAVVVPKTVVPVVPLVPVVPKTVVPVVVDAPLVLDVPTVPVAPLVPVVLDVPVVPTVPVVPLVPVVLVVVISVQLAGWTTVIGVLVQFSEHKYSISTVCIICAEHQWHFPEQFEHFVICSQPDMDVFSHNAEEFI